MRRTRVLLGVLVVGALALAACGDDDDGGSGATATTAAPTSAATGSGDAMGATVSVYDHPELGEILVGPDGRTLYLFEADQGTTTACTGGCADIWPALAAAEPAAGEGVDAAKLETADAQVPDQVVYNGHLLYYYAPDTAPGEAKGLSIARWKAVSPAGEPVGG